MKICPECDHDFADFEKDYMICPKCNKLIYENVPQESYKKAIIYEHSLEIMKMKKIVSIITIILMILFLVLQVQTSLYFYSRFEHVSGVISEAHSFMSESRGIYLSIFSLIVIVPSTIFYHLKRKYDIPRIYNLVFVIITIVLDIIFFKYFIDNMIPDFQNECLEFLTRWDRIFNLKKRSFDISKEMSLQTDILYYGALIFIICNVFVVMLVLHMDDKITTIQKNLIKMFKK